ncbi:MAG: hypothetical protein KC417_08495, partial [Myxococcales bacterium]|nr:hypothetical protein [Myxococcales bacterium]
FEDACRGIRRGMVIHGHLHDCFHLGTAHVPGMPLQTFCAGSATDAKHNGFWVYEINGEQSRALRGGWAGAEYALDGTVVPLDVSLSGSL